MKKTRFTERKIVAVLKKQEAGIKTVELCREEIQKIESLILPEDSLIWHSRNIFLFSFYMAGIRASDCIKLKWENVKEVRLEYNMEKNEQPVSLKIVTSANEILDKYRKPGIRNGDFIFPLLKNHQDYSDNVYLFNQVSSKNALINKYLKKIADLAGIEKNLGFQIARHSFTSLAKNEMKISTEIISELLSHSLLSVTKQYLNGSDSPDMDQALESIRQGKIKD